MLAEELITDDIPLLRPDDSVGQALEWMDEFKVSHLPVTKGRAFHGIVEESTLFNAEHPDDKIGSLQTYFITSFVSAHQHVFEVVKKVSDHNLSVIPILDDRNNFLGSISVHMLMEAIADMPVVKNPGGIIVLEMSMNDYSLFEIARIVEENGVKILGSFITRFPDSTKIELTIKVNREEIQAILQSLERFNYNVTASYDKGNSGRDLQDRYDLLMKYMDM